MKHRIKGIIYIIAGVVISISSFISWKGTGFVWGRKWSVDGGIGGSYMVLALIGLALVFGGFFEFSQAKLDDNDNDNNGNN